MLCHCSAAQLGPLALRVNGPSNSARRRQGTTALAQQFVDKARLGAAGLGG